MSAKDSEQVQLKNALLLYEALLDAVPNPIFAKTQDAHFCFFNKAYESFFNMKREDLLGKSVLDLEYLPLEARKRYQEEDLAAIEQCSEIHYETEYDTKEGKKKSLYWSRGIRVPATGEKALIGQIVDISRLKELEKSQKKSLEELHKSEEELKVKSEELQAAQASNEAKREFLANMSHEIRTPMSGIIGLAHLLSKMQLDDKQADYVAKIASSAQSLLSIINDILDFSKIEAGMLRMEHIPFVPADVLASVEPLFAEKVLDTGVVLDIVQSEQASVHLLGDPVRLRQVLINLVGNAFKFTQKGKVSVAVSQWDGAPQGKTGLRFSVSDTGIGMTQEEAEKVFSPFVQADASITRRFGGTGLGLSISKHLVTLMGGEFSITSEPGKGTTISFVAPFDPDITSGENKNIASHAEVRVPDLRGMRVLMAEDNEINCLVASEILKETGVELTTVENGKKAVDLLEASAGKASPFDLVLMDLQMPVMGGNEATQRIRAMPCYAELPIVALSAHAYAEEKEKIAALGTNGYLTKPLDLQELYATLCKFKPA